jgi:hypothetical protein
LKEYVKLNDLETRLESYATDEELAQETKKVEEKVEEKVTEVVEEKENIRYGDFELRDE